MKFLQPGENSLMKYAVIGVCAVAALVFWLAFGKPQTRPGADLLATAPAGANRSAASGTH